MIGGEAPTREADIYSLVSAGWGWAALGLPRFKGNRGGPALAKSIRGAAEVGWPSVFCTRGPAGAVVAASCAHSWDA